MTVSALCMAFGLLAKPLLQGPSTASNPPAIELESPTSSAIASETHPTSNLRIKLRAVLTKAGAILDMVGDASPPKGAMALFWKDARFLLMVYDPSQKSERMSGLWHALLTEPKFAAGEIWEVELEFGRKQTRLLVNGVQEAAASAVFELAPRTIYVGDSPVDDDKGKHLAAEGEIQVLAIERLDGAGANPNEEDRDSAVISVKVGQPVAALEGVQPSEFLVRPASPGPEGLPAGSSLVAMHEVALGKRRHFINPVVLTAPIEYQDKTQAMGLRAAVFDEDSKRWTLVPTRVDLEKGLVQARTTHLCKLGWFVWRRWFRDIAETEHFRIAFKAASLRNEGSRGDLAWGLARAAEPPLSNAYPKGFPTDMPLFIQDLAEALEWSYQNYKREGFAMPSSWWKTDVLVEGSEHILTLAGGSDPFREKLSGMIWVPERVDSQALLRRTAAHELFHCIQNETFGIAGMNLRPWLMEATAEYAAVRIGMKGKIPLMEASTRWHEQPLTTMDDTHEYDSAQFISFLDANGVKFRDLWTALGSDRTGQDDWGTYAESFINRTDMQAALHALSVEPMRKWSARIGKDITKLYKEFLRVSLTSTASFSKRDPALNLFSQIGSAPVMLRFDKPVASQRIALAPSFGARIWPVLLSKETPSGEVVIKPTAPLPQGVSVDVLVGLSASPTFSGAKMAGTLTGASKVREISIRLEQDEAVYALAVNSGPSPAAASLSASLGPGVRIQPGTVNDGHASTPYTFTVLAERLPTSMKKGKVTLSFGDGSAQASRQVLASKGGARMTCSKVFGKTGTFRLQAVLESGGKAAARGEAIVKITRTGKSQSAKQHVTQNPIRPPAQERQKESEPERGIWVLEETETDMRHAWEGVTTNGLSATFEHRELDRYGAVKKVHKASLSLSNVRCEKTGKGARMAADFALSGDWDYVADMAGTKVPQKPSVRIEAGFGSMASWNSLDRPAYSGAGLQGEMRLESSGTIWVDLLPDRSEQCIRVSLSSMPSGIVSFYFTFKRKGEL